MTLERKRLGRYADNRHLPGLLSALGLPQARRSNPKPQERRGGFWKRNATKLELLLHEIHSAYQETICRVHPDRPGGSHELAVSVNKAWAKIKRLFAKRGITLN